MKERKDCEPEKEFDIALKAFSRKIKKKNVATLTTSEDDKELTLLVNNIKSMVYKSERRSDPRWKAKKKAKKATTWVSDSEFEYGSTHICFMFQGDDLLEVNSESELKMKNYYVMILLYVVKISLKNLIWWKRKCQLKFWNWRNILSSKVDFFKKKWF